MKLFIMKFNTAFRGEVYLFFVGPVSFECFPGEKNANTFFFFQMLLNFLLFCRIFFSCLFELGHCQMLTDVSFPTAVAQYLMVFMRVTKEPPYESGC